MAAHKDHDVVLGGLVPVAAASAVGLQQPENAPEPTYTFGAQPGTFDLEPDQLARITQSLQEATRMQSEDILQLQCQVAEGKRQLSGASSLERLAQELRKKLEENRSLAISQKGYIDQLEAASLAHGEVTKALEHQVALLKGQVQRFEQIEDKEIEGKKLRSALRKARRKLKAEPAET